MSKVNKFSNGIVVFICIIVFIVGFLGGFVGYADESSLTNNTNCENAFIISITLTISGGSPIVNVGALVGEVGTNGTTLTGNVCTYFENVSGSLVEKTNQIGKQN